MFPAGTLWDRIQAVSRQALASGALQPIETSQQTMEDRGVPFVIRRVERMPAKPGPPRAEASHIQPNPFLPYEPELFIANASPTHVCLLNKFNVVAHHLLIVTKHFEHQETILTANDFDALWRCMPEFDAVGFYNSGVVAGASQPHKHLQMVPLPIGRTPPPVPMEVFLAPQHRPTDRVLAVDELPFPHAAIFWKNGCRASPCEAARASHAAYREMLAKLDIAEILDKGPPAQNETRLSKPYNLLVHRRWMLMVPRQSERFHTNSLNALAFAGALLVHDDDQLEQLKAAGPLTALQRVAGV